ncbi:MAG: cysteine desulfurase family protein [Bacillota bacterium]
MGIIYFDNSATTKPYREVIDEVAECMEKHYGNPSSAHRMGLEAEKIMKKARESVAKLISANSQEIYFTSGGSEANNTAITGMIGKGDHIITSRIEHPSVIRLIEDLMKEGIEASLLDVDSDGIVCLAQLKKEIKQNTKLVTIMHVNNEVGSIQPIEEISSIIRSSSRKAKLHVDAVQSAGKLAIDVNKLGIDLLTVSAHKIHGPKGIGALYIRKGLELKPLIRGGGQECNVRSGTENTPGIAGFGVAAKLAAAGMGANREKVAGLKSYFIRRLEEIQGIKINSPADEKHIPHILNVSFEKVRGEVLLHSLEEHGVYVSTGSACSARDKKHSNYVLPAIGLKEMHIIGSIRFSFSSQNTIEEVDSTIEVLKKILPFLRRINK